MSDYIIQDTTLQGIANSIRGKTGGTSPIQVSNMASEIDSIQTGGGGGGTVTKKDINFYDYDGTLLHSYTLSELQSLTALPSLPSHSGLTCQGWNWTLADIKAEGKETDIGAMYITNDGKTRLYIHIADVARNRVPLLYTQTVSNGVNINWGDGSESETLGGTGNKSTFHIYAQAGDYIITLQPIGDCIIGFGNGSKCIMGGISGSGKVYYNMLQKVEIGSNVTSINNHAFNSCYSLSSITIPSGVTSIGSSAFYNCYSLLSITIPSGVTSIDTSTFSNCSSLSNITISSGATSIGNNAFSYCYSLSSITMPNGVTSIGIGAFGYCSSLSSITIPSGVTSIGGSAFNNCSSLSSITIPSGVTSIGASAFYYCSSLSSITIQSGVTSIGDNVFDNCSSLSSINIPSGITSIGNYAFRNCYSLSSITIPSGVTSIGNYAFYSCTSVGAYHFKPNTPPTLGGTTVFNGMPADCLIYVPNASIETYKTATNWTSVATKMRPSVATYNDLSQVDTTQYTRAWVEDTDKAYNYNGTNWVEA